MLRKTLCVVSVVLLWNSLTPAQASNARARKFDEFGDIEASDLIARLDNFAVMLSSEPSSKGFLIVYRTRRDLPGLSNRYAHRMKNYLTESRGLGPERIVIVDGGVASCLSQELWIVPPNSAPKPREDAYDNSYRPSVYKFDDHYYRIGNDPAEIIHWPTAPANLVGYLESFAETLLKDRKLIGYLVAFRQASHDNPQVTKRMLRTERNFLIREFRIEPWRLKTVDGGYRPWRTMELWIAQPGYRLIITSYRIDRVQRRR